MPVGVSRAVIAPLFLLTAFEIAPGSAQAAMSIADIFKNATYNQSGAGGATITATGGFFNATVVEQAVGDFTSASVTLPDASVQNLPQVATNPTNFGIGPSFATRADLDAAYPMGSYILSASGGSAPDQSVTLTYNQDVYAANIPALVAASYDALQGLNIAGGPLTIAFDVQQANPAATSAFTFFTIFGSDQTCGFLDPSVTSCTIDPSHLTAGTTYTYELDFSDRTEQTVDGVLLGVDFDVRTDGTFTTTAAAVPEAATWATMLGGFGMIGCAMRRRRAFGPATA